MLKNNVKINESTKSNKLIMILSDIKPNYEKEYIKIKELLNGYAMVKQYASISDKNIILFEYQEYKEICERFLQIKLDNSKQNADLISSKKIMRKQLNEINNLKYQLFDQ